MTGEKRSTRLVAVYTAPLTSSARLHWDDLHAVSQEVGLQHVSAHGARATLPAPYQSATGRQARSPLTPKKMSLIPSTPPAVIDCDKEAEAFTFYLDPGLLRGAVHNLITGATGTLVWGYKEADDAFLTPAVHPMLMVQTAYGPLHGERIEVVLHLLACDPLHHHIVMVLQAASAADSIEARLYAETLANALAVHFLRRYAAFQQAVQEGPGGLTPAMLRRTLAYIQDHLQDALPLATLAAVVQLSPNHFARLFKQATGRTPHHYVLECRIRRAQQFLAETDLPLSAIGLQVGWPDQSYFTALFRRHVAMTPKAYRATTRRS